MKVPFFDLKRQYQSLKDALEPAVAECLASCGFIEGPKVKELERSLCEYLGVKHAITCGNGTDALKLALRAVGVKPGDEVITTPFSFFATAEAIAAVGATPVFVDVREDDYNLDPAKLEAAVTAKTRAILPVDIFGSPADMDAILGVARRHGLKVVDDACQAIGARYKGARVGSIADATCFSFYPTKNLGAFGDGGMVTTNDDAVANNCRALKAHGAGKAGATAYAQLSGEAEALPEVADRQQPLYDPYKYYNYLVGENSRLDSLQAVVLLEKLKHLDEYNRRREAIAARYLRELADTPLRLPHMADAGSYHCWHQFAVMADDRDALAEALAAREIGTGAFYPVPLNLQKAFRSLGYREGDLPVADSLCRRSVCLPVFPELTEDEVGYIIAGVRVHYGKAAQ